MRVLFVIAETSVEPLGIMILSAELKSFGHTVDLYKYASLEELKRYIDGFKPEIVALSMTTGVHTFLLEVAREIKSYRESIIIVAGGPHITYFPSVGEDPNLDFIVRGEADFSFPSLLYKIEKGNPPKKKDASIMFLPQNLDRLPFPDRSIVYKYSKFLKNRVRNVMTSRGCPFNCEYCYNSAYKKLYSGQKIVRYRSAENIVKECEKLIKEYPTSMIFFADDDFSVNIERLREIAVLYKRRVKIPFHCQLRIDCLNEERVMLLKRMGCYSVTYAIESGDESIRKHLLNRNVSDKDILEGARLLRKYKIKSRVENMIGLPNESYEQILKTLDLNIKVKPTYSWVSLYQPFPGTGLGEYCLSQGWFDGNNDAIKAAFTEETVLNFSKEYKKKLVNMQRVFSIVVSFPWIKRGLPNILNISCTQVLTKIRDKWKKHCYKKLFIGVR